MPTVIGRELPPDLYERLNGSQLDATRDKVVLGFTIDSDGWPHPAMLSYFEVAAVDRQHVRLAVYGDSHTTGNMRARGKTTLAIVDRHLAYYIKGTVEQLAATMRSAPYNAKMNLRIEQVLADAPSPTLEPGAFIAGGITFVGRTTADEIAQSRAIHRELLE